MSARAGWNGFAGRIWPAGSSLEAPGLKQSVGLANLTVETAVAWKKKMAAAMNFCASSSGKEIKLGRKRNCDVLTFADKGVKYYDISPWNTTSNKMTVMRVKFK